MTRRSVVGPLILILLGGLFLAHNVVPELEVFKLLSTYWPFLLIAWGVLRLIEVLLTAAASRPLPARGLSGGEVFLIILICLVGLTSTAVSRHWPRIRLGDRGMEIFGETYDYTLSQEKAVGEKARIVFDNLRGNVRVSGGDYKGLRLTGRKTIRAFDKADAGRTHEKTPLEITQEGDRIVVRTNQDKVAENRNISADLEVTVPRGASIEGRGRYGDFDINDIDGVVEITSDNAGVRLNRIGGNAKIDLGRSDIVRAVDVKGSLELNGRRTGGDIEIENVQGPVTVTGAFGGNLEFKNLPRQFRFESRNTELRVEKIPGRLAMNLGNLTATNLVGPVRVTSRSKDIKIEDFTESLEVDVDRGDVEIRPKHKPLPKIAARSRSGSIELVLPEGARFELSATTERGEARNEYGDALKVEEDGRTATIKGKTGQGPTLSVTTSRGSVTVRKE